MYHLNDLRLPPGMRRLDIGSIGVEGMTEEEIFEEFLQKSGLPADHPMSMIFKANIPQFKAEGAAIISGGTMIYHATTSTYDSPEKYPGADYDYYDYYEFNEDDLIPPPGMD